MKIKKTLATLLTAGALAMGAGKARADIIFEDGFEQWDSGYSAPYNGWVSEGSSPYILTNHQDQIYSGSQSLVLEGTSGGNGPIGSINKTIQGLSGNIRFEWYTRATTLASSGSINGSSILGFILTHRNDGGYQGSWGIKPDNYGDDNLGTTIADFRDDGYYNNIRYRIDVDTLAQTISYNIRSMNGGWEASLNGLPYNETPTTFTLNGGQRTDLYGNTGQGIFDEVSVSITPESSTLALLGLGSLVAFRKRKN